MSKLNTIKNLEKLPSSSWHIFLIWNKSLQKKTKIIEDIQKQFIIKEIFEISWSSNLFLENLTRFYGATLPDPQKKLKECGNGPFLVILVIDENANYRDNGIGLQRKLVNSNVFDTKMKYRKWIGTDFAIHASNTQDETNHDLSLLFGQSLYQIIEKLPNTFDGKIKKVNNNLIGYDGWSSLSEVFHVLNNSTNYVILRNFEELDDKNLENIKDIDILTDDFWQISYIVNKKLKKNNESGPSSFVKIKNHKIKFDFKVPGDGYFDKNWQNNILKKKTLSKNGYYVPDTENHFFSLLYHTIIHKQKITEKNFLLLKNLAKKLEIDTFSESRVELNDLKSLLDSFMHKNNYLYTNTFSYKIKNPRFIKQLKISVAILKKQGIKKLLRAIKDKFYRQKLVKSGKF